MYSGLNQQLRFRHYGGIVVFSILLWIVAFSTMAVVGSGVAVYNSIEGYNR